MKKILFMCIVLVLNLNFALAKDELISPEENIISYEFLSYSYDELYSKVELNYYFSNKVFNYIELGNDSLSGSVLFQISFSAKNSDLPTVSDTWVYRSVIGKSEYNKEISLFGNKYIGLLPNDYSGTLSILSPIDSSVVYTSKFDISVPDYNNKFIFSDLQIAYQIESEKNITHNWNDAFYKNSLFVLPNPIGELKSNNPKLYLYFEIYNASIFLPEGLKVDYTILDAAKNTVLTYSKNKNSYNDAMVEYIEIPLSDLASGVYYISVTSYGVNSNQNEVPNFKRIKKFYVLNPDLAPNVNSSFSESLVFEESSFSSYSEKEIDEEFEKIGVLLTPAEKDGYKLLTDLKAKQRAIFKYWIVRDPKPETKVNEKMIEFDKRVKYSETYFNQGGIAGWRTERGRTLLKYGFPTERNIYPQKDERVPAEEWFYAEIRGGVYFYFVDRLQNGTFILAHSTMPGEVYNPYWYTDYKPAIDSDGSLRFQQEDRYQRK